MQQVINNEAVYAENPDIQQKVSTYFDKEQMRALTARSNWMGFRAILINWGVIVGTMVALVYARALPWYLFVPVLLLGMAVLAGRQISLAIMVHDASHASLFESRWLNLTFADWVCARPLWNNLDKYREYHLRHHAKTGREGDPDRVLVEKLPTTPASIRRKFLRDFSGVSGLRYLIGRVMMDIGLIEWTVTGEVKRLPQEGRGFPQYVASFFKEATPFLILQAFFVGILLAFDQLWLFGVWWLTYITFFMASARFRSMAEHAGLPFVRNMFMNTRTTKAGWIARTFWAPLQVNYHQEHHLIPSAPYFRLAEVHERLRAQNAVPEAATYAEVLKIMQSKGA